MSSFRLLFLVTLAMLQTICHGKNYNDIVISEIMSDPSPVVGLPEIEYIELYNRSEKPVNLKNWTLIVGNRSATFPDSVILPGIFYIVCGQAGYKSIKNYDHVIPVSSLALPNETATLSLFNRSKTLIFSITYNLKWWDADKRNGGYAIEMIDLQNPCGEDDNWKTSIDISGGTPGKLNSVRGNTYDNSPPEIERIDIISPKELKMVFSEQLDSMNAVSGARIEVDGRSILSRKLELPTFKNLVLTLDSPLIAGIIYSVSISNLADCSGNILRKTDFTIGLPSKADSGDVVLNEILFNPPENGVDFVEIYNTSNKFISLKNWSIGNTKGGQPDVFRTITTENFILAPLTYLAINTDTPQTKNTYTSDKSRNFFEIDALPSFSNTSGGVILRDSSNAIFDRFDYSETMHDPLISDPKGVSLEKKDMLFSSQLPDNWHSAASTSGNATPGYANSQMKPETNESIFLVEPEAFIPGNNGVNDFAKIVYKLTTTGETATIRIYDTAGRLIKNLVRNQLIGTSGEIRWGGTNENGNLVDTGYYLILVDSFNGNGQTSQFKLKVVVLKK
ncbi:lamin tail domain-containing protein [Dyadobacter sp. CY345]|uniref:lamin tail domain-containing protein n=1 Tax=Dyadobacter sp. CY345 TaxID=2909335 RepID=UPI001F3C6C33|nr:lamin tail domain-containing protein [Dyadobacter sp. CY345]MCF2442812.1 lamin tail domain-containing protein [Dyadobacter sp. CY345]